MKKTAPFCPTREEVCVVSESTLAILPSSGPYAFSLTNERRLGYPVVASPKCNTAYNPLRMRSLGSMWHWLTVNWGPFSLGTGLGAIVGFVFNVFKWWFPSREALNRRKKENERKKFDSKVLDTLSDQQVPRSIHGMTGGGMPLTFASEVAAYLEADQDDVEDSLQRLQLRGRIRQDSGYWFIIPH